MRESDFNDLVEEIVEQLEDELDEIDADLDIDSSGGLLTIKFPNGSTVVLSRQIALYEIWIAARSGGFHLGYVNDEWFCRTTEETLSQLMGRVVSEQLDQSVHLLS